MKMVIKRPLGRSALFPYIDKCLASPDASESVLALIIIYVHHLHDINLSFGYDVGDSLMEHIFDRIADILRDDDIVTYVSDNEIALILPRLKSGIHATLATNKIIELSKEPFTIHDNHVIASLSIGIALDSNQVDQSQVLVKRADVALNQSKSLLCPYVIYSDEELGEAAQSLVTESAIEQAMDNDEISLYYQPKINLSNNTIYGVEALSRWISPSRGFISPALFIPVVENTKLSFDYTLWTLNVALRQGKAFSDAGMPISVAVNLPANILHHADVVDLVIQSTKIWGFDVSFLTLEITESAMMVHQQYSMDTLYKLRDAGISLSIDDYGTGHSSLAYLRQLPVEELKIDQSFVMDMCNKKDDAVIVRSTIELAHNFDLRVTAEGIEDEATMKMLAEMGCDRAQGYYFARPMPFDDMMNWLKMSPWSQFSH